jgi:hypothetical protein
VHDPQVTTSMFDLTVYATSMRISAHLRKLRIGSCSSVSHHSHRYS